MEPRVFVSRLVLANAEPPANNKAPATSALTLKLAFIESPRMQKTQRCGRYLRKLCIIHGPLARSFLGPSRQYTQGLPRTLRKLTGGRCSSIKDKTHPAPPAAAASPPRNTRRTQSAAARANGRPPDRA